MKAATLLRVNNLVDHLNKIQGYSARYRIMTYGTASDECEPKLGLYKAEGQLDRNISGWLPADEMVQYLAGFFEGYGTLARRTSSDHSMDHADDLERGLALSIIKGAKIGD